MQFLTRRLSDDTNAIFQSEPNLTSCLMKICIVKTCGKIELGLDALLLWAFDLDELSTTHIHRPLCRLWRNLLINWIVELMVQVFFSVW
jgi:hypothetical protein